VTGLNYEEKGFRYQEYDQDVAVHSRYSYLSMPITLRYSLRRGFIRPYVLAGPRLDFFTGSTDDIWGVASDYNDFVLGLSLGGGIEFWSDRSKSIFIECVYNHDFSDACETVPLDPGSVAIIRNKTYNISLGIGFN